MGVRRIGFLVIALASASGLGFCAAAGEDEVERGSFRSAPPWWSPSTGAGGEGRGVAPAPLPDGGFEEELIPSCIEVEVRTLDAEPVPEALLLVREALLDDAAPVERRADADGRAELCAQTDYLLVEVWDDDGGWAHEEVWISDAIFEEPHRIVLSRPGRILGRVVDEVGRPVPDVPVLYDQAHLRDDAGVILSSAAGFQGEEPQRTDSAGRFELTVRPGVWQVGVPATPSFQPATEGPILVRVDESLEVEIALSRGGTIVAMLTGPQGPLLEGYLRMGHLLMGSNAAGGEGPFRFDGLVPGQEYRFVASAPDHLPRVVTVVAGQPGAPEETTIELEPGARLNVEIDGGRPSGCATVVTSVVTDVVVDVSGGEPRFGPAYPAQPASFLVRPGRVVVSLPGYEGAALPVEAVLGVGDMRTVSLRPSERGWIHAELSPEAARANAYWSTRGAAVVGDSACFSLRPGGYEVVVDVEGAHGTATAEVRAGFVSHVVLSPEVAPPHEPIPSEEEPICYLPLVFESVLDAPEEQVLVSRLTYGAASIQPGDRILGIEGRRFEDGVELENALFELGGSEPGTVRIDLARPDGGLYSAAVPLTCED